MDLNQTSALVLESDLSAKLRHSKFGPPRPISVDNESPQTQTRRNYGSVPLTSDDLNSNLQEKEAIPLRRSNRSLNSYTGQFDNSYGSNSSVVSMVEPIEIQAFRPPESPKTESQLSAPV
ncbi:hypothetical protein HK096_009874, partial [Nowakowskiella sp. JEL0078]